MSWPEYIYFGPLLFINEYVDATIPLIMKCLMQKMNILSENVLPVLFTSYLNELLVLVWMCRINKADSRDYESLKLQNYESMSE